MNRVYKPLFINRFINTTNKQDPTIVECPLLNEMRLSCLGLPAFTLSRMFHHLSVPDLQKFTLRGFSRRDSHGFLSFSSFLAVTTRLEILDISFDTFSEAAFTELLRGLPTIRRLEIEASPGEEFFDDNILDLLTPSDDLPSPCCPALEQLVIQLGHWVSDAALLRLINARMTIDSCSLLKRVEVSFSRQRQLDILPHLRQFGRTGFHISLQYHAPVASDFFPWDGPDPQWDEFPYRPKTDTSHSTIHYGF
ncbi:hypothetical protein DFH06DRAFT_1409645 [Mycena polygramma]|nr:hypothetical protein DFH06DRAFT_1409645 [Mycena polygramma]